jgi:hypothetical protein
MTLAELAQLFEENARPSASELHAALEQLAAEYAGQALGCETASGFRVGTARVANRSRLAGAPCTRALLETLALIAASRSRVRDRIGTQCRQHRQDAAQRNWIRVVGHRDLPSMNCSARRVSSRLLWTAASRGTDACGAALAATSTADPAAGGGCGRVIATAALEVADTSDGRRGRADIDGRQVMNPAGRARHGRNAARQAEPRQRPFPDDAHAAEPSACKCWRGWAWFAPPVEGGSRQEG